MEAKKYFKYVLASQVDAVSKMYPQLKTMTDVEKYTQLTGVTSILGNYKSFEAIEADLDKLRLTEEQLYKFLLSKLPGGTKVTSTKFDIDKDSDVDETDAGLPEVLENVTTVDDIENLEDDEKELIKNAADTDKDDTVSEEELEALKGSVTIVEDAIEDQTPAPTPEPVQDDEEDKGDDDKEDDKDDKETDKTEE